MALSYEGLHPKMADFLETAQVQRHCTLPLSTGIIQLLTILKITKMAITRSVRVPCKQRICNTTCKCSQSQLIARVRIF